MAEFILKKTIAGPGVCVCRLSQHLRPLPWSDPCVVRGLLQPVQQLPDPRHHGLLQPGQHQQDMQAGLRTVLRWRRLEFLHDLPVPLRSRPIRRRPQLLHDLPARLRTRPIRQRPQMLQDLPAWLRTQPIRRRLQLSHDPSLFLPPCFQDPIKESFVN